MLRTQLQILDLPVLELNPLNIHLFFFLFSTSQKGAFHQIVKKSHNLYVNFRLWRARPEICRPWTCSRSHTYMQYSDSQIYLLWLESQY
jgi:hypothetical protein